MKSKTREYFNFYQTYNKAVVDVDTTREEERQMNRLVYKVRSVTRGMLRYEAVKLKRQGY